VTAVLPRREGLEQGRGGAFCVRCRVVSAVTGASASIGVSANAGADAASAVLALTASAPQAGGSSRRSWHMGDLRVTRSSGWTETRVLAAGRSPRAETPGFASPPRDGFALSSPSRCLSASAERSLSPSGVRMDTWSSAVPASVIVCSSCASTDPMMSCSVCRRSARRASRKPSASASRIRAHTAGSRLPNAQAEAVVGGAFAVAALALVLCGGRGTASPSWRHRAWRRWRSPAVSASMWAPASRSRRRSRSCRCCFRCRRISCRR
jgi:hypothetical protein